MCQIIVKTALDEGKKQFSEEEMKRTKIARTDKEK